MIVIKFLVRVMFFIFSMICLVLAVPIGLLRMAWQLSEDVHEYMDDLYDWCRK